MLGKRAEIGGEKARHVAGGGIDLPGARPVEGALLAARLAHGLRIGIVALHRAASSCRAGQGAASPSVAQRACRNGAAAPAPAARSWCWSRSPACRADAPRRPARN